MWATADALDSGLLSLLSVVMGPGRSVMLCDEADPPPPLYPLSGSWRWLPAIVSQTAGRPRTPVCWAVRTSPLTVTKFSAPPCLEKHGGSAITEALTEPEQNQPLRGLDRGDPSSSRLLQITRLKGLGVSFSGAWSGIECSCPTVDPSVAIVHDGQPGRDGRATIKSLPINHRAQRQAH